MKRITGVFLKYPEPGRVKTRLAESLGKERAAEIYHSLVRTTLLQARSACPDEIAIIFSPTEKKAEIQQWLDPWLRDFPGEVSWLAQSEGDLGDRLRTATQTIFENEPEAALAIIGTDCIELERETFFSTWETLEKSEADVVLGPAADGGYYLIGLKEPSPELFEDIPWSTAGVFDETKRRIRSGHRTCFELPQKTDIDTIDEYEPFQDRLGLRPCVFFDRDGVVNHSPGEGYVLRKEDFHLSDGIADSLEVARAAGCLTVVVTSQKGVGKKLMSRDDLDDIHHNLQEKLEKNHVPFDAIYSYTGEPGCAYEAKPGPAMIFAAAEELGIDLTSSWIIGDADRDIAMGRNAELQGAIRIRGDKPISIDADHTLDSVLALPELLRKVL